MSARTFSSPLLAFAQNGPVLVFLANVVTLPLIQLVVGSFLIPAFMRQPILIFP